MQYLKNVCYLLIIFMFVANVGCRGSGTNGPSISPADHAPDISIKNNSNQGGLDGGGGNTVRSTKEEILEEIANLKKWELIDVFYEIMFGLYKDQYQQGLILNIRDPQLRGIFKSLIGKGWDWIWETPVGQDLQTTKIVPNMDGPCKDSGGLDRDASVVSNELGSDICVSIPRLMNIPPDQLHFQMSALLVHEFVHHFGFGEADAKLAQKFVTEKILGTDCRIEVSLDTPAGAKYGHRFLLWPKKYGHLYTGDKMLVQYERRYTPPNLDGMFYETMNLQGEYSLIVNKDHSKVNFTALDTNGKKVNFELSWNGLTDKIQPYLTAVDHVKLKGSFNGGQIGSHGVALDLSCFY